MSGPQLGFRCGGSVGHDDVECVAQGGDHDQKHSDGTEDGFAVTFVEKKDSYQRERYGCRSGLRDLLSIEHGHQDGCHHRVNEEQGAGDSAVQVQEATVQCQRGDHEHQSEGGQRREFTTADLE